MSYPERLLNSFQELSELVLSHETVRSTLDIVSSLAVQTIPSCDVASVSLVRADGISTIGWSDQVATILDAMQYETRQGPCLDAITKDAGWFQIDEMSADTRWPDFSSLAAREGFESLLAFPLRVETDRLGALNLYARAANAFSPEDREIGAIYAAHAAVALANAQTVAHGRRDLNELNDALLSGEIIGRAIGILMEGEFRSADEALAVLEARAEQLRVRLQDSAREVVDSANQRRDGLDLPAGFADRIVGRSRTSGST